MRAAQLSHLFWLFLLAVTVAFGGGVAGETPHPIDGVYHLHNGYQSETLELRDGHFRYWFWTDCGAKSGDLPLEGRYTIRNNDIVRFDSPATINAVYLQDLKDDFDVLYAEAGSRRRMMSISTHDRISGIPGRVKLVEEFIKYAQKQKGVVFMRKDGIANWALSTSDVPHEA
jgi:peptidoglycan/xylan/chitin deacetylase (PgdA/CDA1 family)